MSKAICADCGVWHRPLCPFEKASIQDSAAEVGSQPPGVVESRHEADRAEGAGRPQAGLPDQTSPGPSVSSKAFRERAAELVDKWDGETDAIITHPQLAYLEDLIVKAFAAVVMENAERIGAETRAELQKATAKLPEMFAPAQAQTEREVPAHSHENSLYTRCLACKTWGIGLPVPFGKPDGCGNCGSYETVQYYPPCCIRAERRSQAPTAGTFADGIEAAARLCERERCRNWDAKECARQLRDYLKAGRFGEVGFPQAPSDRKHPNPQCPQNHEMAAAMSLRCECPEPQNDGSEWVAPKDVVGRRPRLATEEHCPLQHVWFSDPGCAYCASGPKMKAFQVWWAQNPAPDQYAGVAEQAWFAALAQAPAVSGKDGQSG